MRESQTGTKFASLSMHLDTCAQTSAEKHPYPSEDLPERPARNMNHGALKNKVSKVNSPEELLTANH